MGTSSGEGGGAAGGTRGPRGGALGFAREWRSVIAVVGFAVLGGVSGLATILVGSVTSEFLDVLVATTVTVYGFLIIGLVFVYEQQRWAWPVMWSVRDPERIALWASFAIGLVTGVAGLLLGVALLAIEPVGTVTLWARIGLDVDAADSLRVALRDVGWLAAPLSVMSIVVLGHAVRRVLVLLSPGSLSKRVTRAARSAAAELPHTTREIAEDDARIVRARRWVDVLQRLTVEHLLNRDLEQYDAHIHSFLDLARPVGDTVGAAADGFLTSIAVDRLVTISGLAEQHRDSRIRALECALDILATDAAVGRIDRTERIRLAERVALLLEDVLDGPRPSATVSGLLLRLGLVLRPDATARAGLLSEVLRVVLPMRRPADVWSRISDVIATEVREQRNGLVHLEVAAAVAGFLDRPVLPDDSTQPDDVASDGRSVAQRVLDLFDLLEIEPTSIITMTAKAKFEVVIRAYAWVLTRAEGSGSLGTKRRRATLERFVRLWVARGAARWQELPEELDDAIRRFSPTDWTYIRFAAGIEEMRARGASPSNLGAFNVRREEPIAPEEVRDAIEMVLDTYAGPGDGRAVAAAIRAMLGQDRRHGMMALPTFMILRRSLHAFLLAARDGGGLEPYARAVDFLDIERGATGSKYFNRGLEDCQEICLAEVHEMLNVIGGRLVHVIPDPSSDPRLRQAQGLFRALGLSIFALAVSIDDALGLFVIGRFVEMVPWFARAPRREGDAGGWSTPQLLRLANDSLWISTIAMDLPVRIAPKRAGVQRSASATETTDEAVPSEAYVTLNDGSRALRMRDVWRLAFLRDVLHDIAGLVAHVAPISKDEDLAALRAELEDAVLMGGEAGGDGEGPAPDHLEVILAEAIVSTRRHHYWTWVKAVESLDWKRLGPLVWAAAAERLEAEDADSSEPSGVFGLLFRLVQGLDPERMPNEARALFAGVLQKDLPNIGPSDYGEPFSETRVGSLVASALGIVAHQRVYDSDLKYTTAAACIRWADRTRNRPFARALSRDLSGRTERNSVLIALRRALEEEPKLAIWNWPVLDLGPTWTETVKRVQTQATLKSLGAGTEVEAKVLVVGEKYALVGVPGGRAVLPVAEVSWTHAPDLRMLLQKDETIDLVVIAARGRSDGSERGQLVVSRKQRTPDPRPELRSAIESRARQDAVYLGIQPGTKRALVRLVGFADLVVARLIGFSADAAPEVGHPMRVVVTSLESGGRVLARV